MTRAVSALTRASWNQARSYRFAFAMQVGSLLITVVPLYFITGALQSTMASTIASEADQYFAFVLTGSVGLGFATTGMSSLARVIGGGISSGYFESLLVTRASTASILAGLGGYDLVLTAVRMAVMLVAGWFLGAQLVWSNGLEALLIVALITAAHVGIGLIAAAMVIAFRTYGPLISIVSMVSIFFGGVYYSVNSIPSWLRVIADLTPLSYGLRALRRVFLQGHSFGAVWEDVMMMAALGVILMMIGSVAIRAALRYAKREGTLGIY